MCIDPDHAGSCAITVSASTVERVDHPLQELGVVGEGGDVAAGNGVTSIAVRLDGVATAAA